MRKFDFTQLMLEDVLGKKKVRKMYVSNTAPLQFEDDLFLSWNEWQNDYCPVF